MGYFSNGTEAILFEEQLCHKCRHYQAEEGMCPVMTAHFDHGSDLCNQPDHPGKMILDMMIPEDEAGFNVRCAMFLE